MRGAYAILSPCGQSHAFEDRKVKVGPEDDPLKIGRAVARLKPSTDNAIFDCKVLSRNHAVLYYDDGSFYLKDTKSSNGTFVNNERLAPTGEESEPRQVYSGDIFQFGVEIVENSNKVDASVAHGCIFAIVRLYDETGKEVETPALPTATKTSLKQDHDSYYGFSIIGAHQIFQLQQYLKEALYREKTREEKIRQLEEVLVATDAASETAWKAGVNEDRLLARIESLEATLAIHSKNATTDKLKGEVEKLVEERAQLEATARDNLKRALEERSEALMRLSDVERSMVTMEEECNRYKDKTEDLERCLASSMESLEKHMISADNTSKLLLQTERRAEEAEFRARKVEMIPVEESIDDKIRSCLLHLSCSPCVDKEVLSSLGAVIGLMLGENKEEREEEDGESEDIPPVPHAPTNGDIQLNIKRNEESFGIVPSLCRDDENLCIVEGLRIELEEAIRDKVALEVEIEQLRSIRRRNEGGDNGRDSLSSQREHIIISNHDTREVLVHLPSILLLSIFPFIGIVLLLIFPIYNRLSIQS